MNGSLGRPSPSGRTAHAPRACAGAFLVPSTGPRPTGTRPGRRHHMARPDKAAAVAELTEEFRTSSAAVLTEYRGLTVASSRSCAGRSARTTSYAVVKNTLTKIAAQRGRRRPPSTTCSQGPSAIAFVKGDPVEAAKGLRDFAKAHPLLVIKGGVLDGKPLSPDEIKQARRPRVARGAAGQAGRRDEGLAAERGLPVRRPAVRRPLASSTRCGPRPSRTRASCAAVPASPRRRGRSRAEAAARARGR